MDVHLDEFLKCACVNAMGVLKDSPYKIRRFTPYYKNKLYCELPYSLQYQFTKLHRNLVQLRAGKTYYTMYEGLRKCQIKVHSKKFCDDFLDGASQRCAESLITPCVVDKVIFQVNRFIDKSE